MKTREQVLAYLNDQEWYKDLGLSITEEEGFAMLFVKVMLTYPKCLEYDWEKISDDYHKWLNEE